MGLIALPCVIASANAQTRPNPNPTPSTPPNVICTNTAKALSAASTSASSAISNALGNLPGSKIVKSGNSSASFSIPKFEGPYGYIKGGGQTYTASAEDSATISGLNSGSGNVVASQTSCSTTKTGFTSNGTVNATLAWSDISFTVNAKVTGFSGAQYANATPVKITLKGLTINAPGVFTLQSAPGSSATAPTPELTALSFSNCTTSVNVTATILGSSSSSIASKVQSEIQTALNSSGSSICSTLNTKVAANLPLILSPQ